MDKRITGASGNGEAAGIEPEVARNLSARDLRRVFAFVVDDLTIPSGDMTTVRSVLTNFVDSKMGAGDLEELASVLGSLSA